MIITWLVVGIICLALGIALNKLYPADNKWFMQLRRPRWLTFEKAIPFIWIAIFLCGITSAAFLWEAQPATVNTWLLMVGFAILEIAILAYTPVMTRFRNVRLGAVVGAIGFILGIVLTTQVWQISSVAGWLLVPYLLWSPIGTYVTWVMARLNPPEM